MATRDIAVSVDVDAPVEVTWAAVTDWEHQGEWMLGTAVHVRHGDGASVGSELSATTGVGPAGFTDTMEIVGWDPPYRCTVRHTGWLVRGSGVFAVSPRGESASTFSWTERLELPLGPLGALGWPLASPVFRAGLRASLDRLARRIEARRDAV